MALPGQADLVDVPSGHAGRSDAGERKRGGIIMARRLSSFAERLQTLREAAGLTVPELARKSGLGQQAFAELERGEHEPSWDLVRRLAHALGVSVAAFDGDGETRPNRLLQAAKAYAVAYDQVERKTRGPSADGALQFARFQEAQVELNLAALDLFAAQLDNSAKAKGNRKTRTRAMAR
jgi:transcriptional regulator with XRE-family HTH domain